MKRLPEAQASSIPVTIDGRPFAARAGDSVAATMLAAGVTACRTTPVSGSPRGPFCMMGVCFDCLVTIDGRPNQQGCLVPVREGMRIERQSGARIAIDAPQGVP
ncbi:MAG: (2Fe-2S)-binding protein [Burkholderiaceae bacterium]|jgi:predicted molibdopterin-dependent oxidoreductase YjgC|nr:(2Fe-2S)-binding protein [Burkholderiaceae bacterium]